MLAITAIVMKLSPGPVLWTHPPVGKVQELEDVRKSGQSVHLSSFSTPGEGRCRRILTGLGAAGSALSAVLMLRLHSFNQPFTSFYRSKQFIIRPAERLDTCAYPTSPALLLHVEVFNRTLVFVPVWLHWDDSWLKSHPQFPVDLSPHRPQH